MAMHRIAWLMAMPVLTVGVMACSLATAPISEAQNLALTAEALATAVPAVIPDITGIPEIPGLPDVTGFLNPSGAPASEWRGIPIMPEADAGQEFDSNTYSFSGPGITGSGVADFYDAQLRALGWSAAIHTGVGTAGGYMLFTKGSSALSILVTKSEGNAVVLLIMQ